MYYMYGASAGLAFLALYSDCFIRQHMLFSPILISSIILMLFLFIMYVIGTLMDKITDPNEIGITIEGFIEGPL